MKVTNPKRLWLLITPSAFSGLVIGAITAAIVLVEVVNTISKQVASPAEAFALHQATASNYQTIAGGIDNNRWLSDLPLFIFWCGVGLIIYFLSIQLATGLSSAMLFREELNYVHSDRKALTRMALLHFGLRVITLGAWVLFIILSVNNIVPQGLALIRSATAAPHPSVVLALQGIVGAAIVFADLAVHTVFLRLLFLRIRLFGGIPLS